MVVRVADVHIRLVGVNHRESAKFVIHFHRLKRSCEAGTGRDHFVALSGPLFSTYNYGATS